MPVERMIPDAILEQTNLVGTLASIQNDPDVSDGTWLTATDTSIATSLRVSFPTPSAGITGTQEFRIRTRRVGGTDNPPINLELWINGTSTLVGPSTTVTDTSAGQIISWTWDAGTYNAASVECRVNSPSTGGKPATRATCEIEAVEWNATVKAPPPNPPTDLTATADADSINLAWTAPATGTTPESYRVYRRDNKISGDDSTFTNGIGGWIVSNGVATLSHNVDSLRMTHGDTSSATARTIKVPVSGGDSVYARIQARSVVGTRTPQVGLTFFDAAGASLDAGAFASGTSSPTYVNVEYTKTAPTGAASAEILIRSLSGAANDITEFDNAFISSQTIYSDILTTTYDDISVTADVPYSYLVRSVAGGTESSDSNSVTATLGGSAPIAVSASDTSTLSITELAEFGSTSVQAQDVSSVSIDEGSAFPPIELSSSDTAGLGVADSGTVVISEAGPTEVVGSDTTSLSLGESNTLVIGFEEFIPKTYIRKVSYY